MTSTTGLAKSVHVRLVAHSKEIGVEAQLMLERFALYRLLYRLSKSRHCERFVLKGAQLMLERFALYRLLYRLSKSVYNERFVLSLCWFCEKTAASTCPNSRFYLNLSGNF